MKRGWTKERFLSLAALLLFLSPVLAYWGFCLIIQPAPHYAGIDPEYEYFLNSLAIFKHVGYAYVDHPGTPVEMIGSALLAATYPWLAGRPQGFAEFHLRNPQVFLTLAYIFLVVAHAACALIFFRLARRWSPDDNAVVAAALATMYFAIQPYAFSGSLLWSHNSFSFPFGTLLLLLLYASMIQPEPPTLRRVGMWLGLGLGTGILAATTIFLASWAVGMLVTILLYHGLYRRSWRETAAAVLAFGLASVVGFYLAVLPVIGRMGGFWNWIYSILSHQSSYLAVPRDQSTLQRLAGNAASLFELLPVLAITVVIMIGLACLALVVWRDRMRQQPALWALAGGLSAQVIALTLVFLDRPLRAYYFLGVAAILPVLALVLLGIYQQSPRTRQMLATGMSIAVLTGLVVNSVQAISSRRAEIQMQVKSQNLVQQVIAGRARQVQRPPQNLTILWMYGTYSECWGLWFANQRAGDAFDAEISRICPNQYELAGRVLLPNAKIPLEEFHWDIVFTCERYVDTVTVKDRAAASRVYPGIEWACGKMAAVFK